MNTFLLPLLVLIPLAAAAAILAGAPARSTAIGSTAAGLLAALALAASYDSSAGGFQFITSLPVLPALDINLALGVDGLSLTLLVLTSLVALAAIAVAPHIESNEPAYFACLLLITAGALGAFASTDIFFFYIFHELALIPTFLLIGIWGHGDKRATAWKITLYLALGSIVLLVGLLSLYFALPESRRSFDMVALLTGDTPAIPAAEQGPVFLLLLVGFGILVSLFPFHTWAPQAYASAPTPAAMLHAGVLKKFGLYGLIRLAVPLVPQGAAQYLNLLLVLLACNILYVGLATIAQKRLDLMLGYSSVMHMGYAFLGIAALNATGLAGTSLMLFAHGLSIAALFAICGEIRRKTATTEFSELGGMARCTPFLGLAFGMAAFASVGLPGFTNFPSELMIFFGAFGAGGNTAGGFTPIHTATLIALSGLIISAIYMLRAYRAIFMGEGAERCSSVTDPGKNVRIPIILLLATLLATGFFPPILMNFINPSIQSLITLMP